MQLPGVGLRAQAAALEGGGALAAREAAVSAGRFFSITSRSPLTKWRSAPMVRKPCAAGQGRVSVHPITEARV